MAKLAFLSAGLAGLSLVILLARTNRPGGDVERSYLVLAGLESGDCSEAAKLLRARWPESAPLLRRAARSGYRPGIAAALEALRELGALDHVSVLAARTAFLDSRMEALSREDPFTRSGFACPTADAARQLEEDAWVHWLGSDFRAFLVVLGAGLELGMTWPYDFLGDLADWYEPDLWTFWMGEQEVSSLAEVFDHAQRGPKRRQLRRLLPHVGYDMGGPGNRYPTMFPLALSFCATKVYLQSSVEERIDILFLETRRTDPMLDSERILRLLLFEAPTPEFRNALERRLRGARADKWPEARLALLFKFKVFPDIVVMECLETGKLRGACVDALLECGPVVAPQLKILSQVRPELSLPANAVLCLADDHPTTVQVSARDVHRFPGAAEIVAMWRIAHGDPAALEMVRRYGLDVAGMKVELTEGRISEETAREARARLRLLGSSIGEYWLDPMAVWPAEATWGMHCDLEGNILVIPP